MRFFVDRAVPQIGRGLHRIVYLFSGHDPDAVTEARVAWKALQAGNELTYWQQDDERALGQEGLGLEPRWRVRTVELEAGCDVQPTSVQPDERAACRMRRHRPCGR